MAKPWVHKRRNLKGEAMAKYSKHVRWIGGILYFSKTLIQVPGIPHIPKTGQPVIGKQAHSKYQ